MDHPSCRREDGRDAERPRARDEKTMMKHLASVAVGVRLLHDFVVHKLLELLLGEAVHQLAGLVRRLEVLAVLAYFVDVHLHAVSAIGSV